MADVIKEVAEQATELGMEVKNMEPIIEGPTIFKTSNTAKIVFGVVAGAAAIYGVAMGVRCVLKKKKALKDGSINDIPDDVDSEEVTDVEVDDLD